MPLRDHFHAPWSEWNPWEGFHAMWITTMVRHLNGTILPPQFRAVPEVHLGLFVEADVATFERERLRAARPLDSSEPETGSGPEVWSSPPMQTLEIEFPDQDVYEVRVLDTRQSTRLVAVVELVSPANKDRPEHRHPFVAKCASYLQEQVGVVVVDVVTNGQANLHQELLEMLSSGRQENGQPDLYAASYCSRQKNGKWLLDTQSVALEVGTPLPTIPLYLFETLAVPLGLEASYTETAEVLRISVDS